MSPIRFASVAAAFGLLTIPGIAWAQGVGIGPRISFVTSEVSASAPSARYFGGTLRMQSSRHVVFEVAMDYRTQPSIDRTLRFKERPIQGSLLLFLTRRSLAPYLVAGLGTYAQTTEVMGIGGDVIDSTTTRRNGAHLGAGAELFLGRRVALFADYRFRFVKFGEAEAGAEAIDIPGRSLIPGLGVFKLSHRGSMWSSGLAFYF